MKAVFALFAVLAVSCKIAFASQCQKVPQYTTDLNVACAGEEIYVLWPKYSNVSQYYRCHGQGYPVLLDCPINTYFSYVMQTCQTCNNLIPSQPCETLKFGKNSKCIPIDGSGEATTTTTTAAPTTTTTTTAAPTKTTTTTAAPTTTTTAKTITTTTTTTTTNSDIPPPPSPSTQDPNIPTPPTAAPTPPTIVNTPPSIDNPNSK